MRINNFILIELPDSQIKKLAIFFEKMTMRKVKIEKDTFVK